MSSINLNNQIALTCFLTVNNSLLTLEIQTDIKNIDE